MKKTIFTNSAQILLNRQNIYKSLICTLFVLLSNFFVPSQSNGFPKGGRLNFDISSLWSNDKAVLEFQDHYYFSEFRRRPFVLEFQRVMETQFQIPMQFSFNLINYFSLFFIFLMLPLLAQKLANGTSLGPSLHLFFLLSMPILFAFYGSMRSYNDFLNYLLILVFLVMLFIQKYNTAWVAFILACICREASFIYYLLLLAYFMIEARAYLTPKNIAFWLLPIPIYLLYLKLYLPADLLVESKGYLIGKRFTMLQDNFFTIRSFRESTTQILATLGIVLLLLFQKLEFCVDVKMKKWTIFSVFFIILNLFLISVTGIIPETRLLFLPLIFVVPFLAPEIESAYQLLFLSMGKIHLKQDIPIVLMSFFIAFVWFTPIAKGTGYMYKMYDFLYFLVLFKLFAIWKWPNTKREIVQQNLP